MRSARDTYKVPPTKYLRLPYPEFGETDHLLNAAMDTLELDRCTSCGHFKDECQEEANEGRFVAEVVVCQASAAVERYREQHREDLPPGAIVRARMLAPGEKPEDSLSFDPERARQEYERKQRELGLVP